MNPFADDQPNEAPILAEVSQNLNPYESPREVAKKRSVPVGLWRDGRYLVAHQDSAFPPVCIRTNEQTATTLRCDLRWCYPIDISHRHLYFDVGICEACLKRGKRIRSIGLCLIAGAFLLMILLTQNISFGHPAIAGLSVGAAMIVGVLMAAMPGVSLKVKKPRPPYFWIQGAHSGFLDRLPEWQEAGS